MQPNARFWVFWNDDYVKVTLCPGQEIVLHKGGATDEGWHYEAKAYEYDEGGVFYRSSEGGRDCDGPLEYHRDLFCPVDELKDGDRPPLGENFDGPSHPVVVYPKWRKLKEWQRDMYAEMAGY